MATGTGTPSTTYNLNTGLKLDMEDLIQLMSPTDIPFQGGAGGGDSELTLPTGPVFEVDYKWMDELILTPKSTLAVALADGTGTDVQVAAGDQLKFQPGDIIKIENEYMRVTAYGSTDHLTVTRGYSGSAVAHSTTGVAVICVGQALPEGSVPGTAKFNDRTQRDNFTQIFGPIAVATSATDLRVQKYGVANEYAKQAANRMKELAISLEQALIYGAKLNDNTNKWRSFGGMLSFIQTNVDSSTTTLTEALFLAQVQACWDQGGQPDFAVMGSKQKRVMSAFTSAGTIFVQRPDGQRGTQVNVFESDFGVQQLKLHRWFNTPDLVIARRDQFQICTLRPLTFEPLAKTGDFDQGQIVMEKGFKVYRERHAARFSALT